MKANELRIGNLVQLATHHHPVSVETIFKENDEYWISTDLHEGERLIDYIPIPLTKEWLLKFGFEDVKQYNDFSFQKLMNDGLFFCLDDSLEVYIGQMQYFSHSLVVIKYVHQLQNLYFALTQEELEKK